MLKAQNCKDVFFNAHHSPVGVFASFTLGCKGAKGGFGLELGKPADENIYIGIQSRDFKKYYALPFFDGALSDERKRYEVETADGVKKKLVLEPFADKKIKRSFSIGFDLWKADDISFTIVTPMSAIPDPDDKKNLLSIKQAIIPAVWAELNIDNRSSSKERIAFLAWQGNNPYSNMRYINLLDKKRRLLGIGQGTSTAIFTEEAKEAKIEVGTAFSIAEIIEPISPTSLTFGLGNIAGFRIIVPPKKQIKLVFAICFFRDGVVTAGLPMKYYYRNFFDSIEDVGKYALDIYDLAFRKALEWEKVLAKAKHLNKYQKFQLAHSIRSYYGSTELLDWNGKPVWIVNEGEYRMMNTLDLTVDHLFFELWRNPWVVRNVLDMFATRYSYWDNIIDKQDGTLHPGGISFTHDMGVANVFAPQGRSSYEFGGRTKCFSYMTCEELCNWILCAVGYALNTKDYQWARRNLKILEECLKSLMQRDHYDKNKRDGVMSFDSALCENGFEITTYDSLDASLGQARASAYLAVKCWAVYVCLWKLFKLLKRGELARTAIKQALLCSSSIQSYVTKEDWIPATFDGSSNSKVIQVIEGLVYPYMFNIKELFGSKSPFITLITRLKKHFLTVLKKGVCLFDDGGWKISSSSNNSWLSKIYISQFIARTIFKIRWDTSGIASDKAHYKWLVAPQNVYWCWSDQIVSGVAQGSKYYPRGVTSIIWLNER